MAEEKAVFRGTVGTQSKIKDRGTMVTNKINAGNITLNEKASKGSVTMQELQGKLSLDDETTNLSFRQSGLDAIFVDTWKQIWAGYGLTTSVQDVGENEAAYLCKLTADVPAKDLGNFVWKMFSHGTPIYDKYYKRSCVAFDTLRTLDTVSEKENVRLDYWRSQDRNPDGTILNGLPPSDSIVLIAFCENEAKNQHWMTCISADHDDDPQEVENRKTIYAATWACVPQSGGDVAPDVGCDFYLLYQADTGDIDYSGLDPDQKKAMEMQWCTMLTNIVSFYKDENGIAYDKGW